jgi:hypothetical protein
MANKFDPLRSTNVFLENSEYWMHCHEESVCRGDFCTLHNRSNHPMRSWEQHWRSDVGLMERICPEHGVGHPDPDDFNLRTGLVSGEHGCCMCCSGYYQ